MMTEKLKKVEIAREARRKLKIKKAPANRQDDSPTLTVYYPLCRTLDRLLRLKFTLKPAFDLIRRDAQIWT